jgi:hypothetical protein
MLRALPVLLLVLTACAGARAPARPDAAPPPPPSAPQLPAPPDPEPFRSAEGGFSVKLSYAPAEEQSEQATGTGDVLTHTFTASDPAETTAYFLSYTDFPPETLAQTTPAQLLESAARAGAESLGTEQVSVAPISLAGFPGQEVRARAEGRELRGRVYLVGHRLYQQLLLHPAGAPPADAERYFQSFALDPKVTRTLQDPES